MLNTLESEILAIGNGIMTWMTPYLSSLSLVSFDWADQMRDDPVYPCNPRVDCPRAFLKLIQSSPRQGETIGCANALFTLQLNLWVQLRQTPGQDHQELLIAAIEKVETAFLQQEFDLTEVVGVNSIYRLVTDTVDTIPFTELEHPLGDPQLRVSTSGTQIILAGAMRE